MGDLIPRSERKMIAESYGGSGRGFAARA